MTATISPSPVRKSILVNAAPERAFAVFTANMGRWWLRTHSINGAPMQNVVIEPRVGGRWYEQGEDGSQCDWGKVLGWEPPRRVLLAWQINGEWKYDPALITELEVTFAAEGSGTRVVLEHRHLERMGAAAQAARDAIDSPGGWSGLLSAFAQAVE
jgi:uncharacterized protein YndB with AHSA1/START domain